MTRNESIRCHVLLFLLITMAASPLFLQGQIRSFKFNNRFNHRLFTDVPGDIQGDTIKLSAACIGTWLTPSFQLEAGSVATVQGAVQISKYTRLNFAQPVTYHVENPTTGFSQDYVVMVDFLADHPTGDSGVPCIYIQTTDGRLPTSRSKYKDATIRIDGSGVFPDLEEQPIQIRGRGNSSWNNSDKKPYRIKFDDKQKPFGLTKGRNWVLLANNLSKSALTNAIAMEIAGQVQTVACNHIVPCDLYINGEYRGIYNFTENPGFGNNSIALTDESHAVLLELDSYYDETYKFRDDYYKVCTNVKEPSFADNPDITFDQVKNHYNSFCKVLKNGPDQQLQQAVDVVSVAKARFVTELTRNTEVMHPKSWRLYNPDINNPDSLYVFAPVWDFDWSFGYQNHGDYYQYDAQNDLFQSMGSQNQGYPYFSRLFRGYDSIKREYYRLWVHYNQAQQIEELCNYIDCYYRFVSSSLSRNRSKWHDNTDYASQKDKAKSWLRRRADYLFTHTDPYELDEPESLTAPFSEPQELRPFVDIYDLNGRCLHRQVRRSDVSALHLAPGFYLIDRKLIRL